MDNKTEYIISLKDLFSKGVNDATKAADGLESKVGSLQGMLAKIGAVVGVSALAKGIFDAGTNMESLNISLKTMLGSKGEADKLVAQMVKFASTTPFSQTEVQTAGKQLLAYGIEAKNIIPTLRQLGDVSAGLNQPIGEIAYLYGTIKTQGKAMTVDIKQFANRGIPIYEELAKVTGKSGEALQRYIEDGKIGFPQIQKAFENMSGAGGKFAGLTAELAKSTGGQWSNMKDQLEQLAVTIFNELQPAINWFIEAMATSIGYVKELVKWIKEHQRILKALVIGIGAAILVYKTWTTLIKLAAWYNGLSTAAIIANTLVTEGWTAAQIALNIAMAANPLGIVLAAVVALVAGITLAISKYNELREEYKKSLDNTIKNSQDEEIKRVRTLAQEYEKQGKSVEEARKAAIEFEKVRLSRIESTLNERAEIAEKKGRAARGAAMVTPWGEAVVAQEKAGALMVAARGAALKATAQRAALSRKDIFGATDSASKTDLGKGASGIDSAKTPQHTVITVNIDKMIEKFTITTNNLTEGAQSVKEQIVKAMIEAVNDFQIIAGQ